MAYSYHVYEASGSTRAFGVPFPYLAQGHVHASVNGVEVGTIEWTSTSTINLPSNPSAGSTVRVWRQTPIDEQAVRFSGGVLTTRDLNRLSLVNLFTAQEAYDASEEARDMAGGTEEAALDAYNSSEHADAMAASIENWATVVGAAYESTIAAKDEAVAAVGDTVRYTPQTNSSERKAQARDNLGLHEVASSGAYDDLSGKPTLGSAAGLDADTTGADKVLKRSPAGVIVESRWDVVAEHREASGTGPGSAVSGIQDRTLNSLTTNHIGATLSGNILTIPVAGTFEAEWDAPAGSFNGGHQALLTRSNNTVLGAGTSETNCTNSVTGVSRSEGRAEISLAAGDGLKIRHFIGGSYITLGLPASSGQSEVYTRLRLKRIA